MDNYASTVAQNEDTFIPKGKGIGGATTDLPKPEKQDCEDTNSLVDLPKPANHLESEEVEASSLKRKSSQQGTETTKRAQTSNICTGNLSRISYAGPPVESVSWYYENGYCTLSIRCRCNKVHSRMSPPGVSYEHLCCSCGVEFKGTINPEEEGNFKIFSNLKQK